MVEATPRSTEARSRRRKGEPLRGGQGPSRGQVEWREGDRGENPVGGEREGIRRNQSGSVARSRGEERAQRAGRRHTVLLIQRPLLAAPGSVCPFRKRLAIPS